MRHLVHQSLIVIAYCFPLFLCIGPELNLSSYMGEHRNQIPWTQLKGKVVVTKLNR